MFQNKFVFAQLVAFLDRSKFNRIVAKYNGDRYVKHLTCWNQFLAMMFGQLSNRESLRDLIVALEAHHSKCYHLGMGKNVSKSSLARANQDRNYRIFEEYAFDSTTIDLCLEVFWRAKFRKKKGGIKVHTLYDVETQIPTFFHITTASTHDSKAMSEIPYETGSYYIFDRAYNKFSQLFSINQIGAYFVVRAKKNVQYKIVKWKRRLHKNVLSDCIIEFTEYKSMLPFVLTCLLLSSRMT